MNRKKFITTWIAAALLVSCSADWEPDTQPCELLPIRLTANAGGMPALPEGTAAPGHTRAASTDGLQNTEFAEGEDVAVYLVDCDNAVGTYTATPYRYRTSAAVAGQNALTYYSDATTPSMLYFPADAASNVDVYAFYPYSRFENVADRATSNLDVTVGTDQSTAAAYRASDVMMATPVTDHSRYPKTDNAVELTFRHLMARLVVRLKQGTHAGTTSAITAASLAGSTLTIGSVATEATLNMTDGTVTTGSDATTVTVADADLAFYYDNTDAAISSTEYAIVLPAQALTLANVVTITTAAGETISGTLPAITLTAGSSTVLTLTVNDSGIEATRADYGNGGSKTWEKNPFEDLTDSDVGKVIGADGKIYATKADAEAVATGNAVAMIAYVGSDNGEAAPYNHGLALALSDANGGTACKWKTSYTDAGHTKQTSSTFTEESGLQYNATQNTDEYPAFQAAIANNGTAAPTGCSSWFLASGYQWQKMIGAAGLSNLGLQEGASYWSSSELSANDAWDVYSLGGYWFNDLKGNDYRVRACLAF